MLQVFGDALNLKFQGTFNYRHPLLMTWPSSLDLTYKIINRRKTNFISKIIVFIKIKRVVEKWSLRSKSINITGTNMIVTRMIIFLWFNIFHRLQTKNMCRVFNGFNQVLDFCHHFFKSCQQFDDYRHFDNANIIIVNRATQSLPCFFMAWKKSRLEIRFGYAKLMTIKMAKTQNLTLFIFQ